MYPTKNTMPENTRIQMVDMLQTHLSNSLDLKTQAKQAHWNVKGPDFIALHELFDKISASAEEYTDLVAERIMQLGGAAEGQIRIAAKRTQLPEYPLNISGGQQHVNALAQTLASYGEHTRKAIHNAEEIDDAATADIMTEITREVDKYLWFVEAHLQASK